MPTIFIRCMLFMCSYSPLLFITCVLLSGTWPWWKIALLASVGVLSLLITWLYFCLMLRRSYVEQKEVTSFSRRDTDVMGYIAAYLIPFVTFPLSTPQQQWALLLFVVVLLVVYVNSNMIYINPVLNIFGYHLYEIEVEHSQRSHYYMARKPLERNHIIRFIALSDEIYLEHP